MPGNDRTFVGLSLPRHLRLRRRLSAAPTMRIASASGCEQAAALPANAASAHDASVRACGTPRRFVAICTVTSSRFPFALRGLFLLVFEPAAPRIARDAVLKLNRPLRRP